LPQDDEVVRSRNATNTSKATGSLRKIADLTTGLPEDSPVDAQLRDRLELAADVLDAVNSAEDTSDQDRYG
jgi:hypothetical protein